VLEIVISLSEVTAAAVAEGSGEPKTGFKNIFTESFVVPPDIIEYFTTT